MNQIRLTSYGWDKIISFALQSLGPLIPAAFLVIGTKSSAKAWSCLKKTYANASRSQILNLKTTLARTNMDTMSVSEYLMTIKHMADELALIGASLSEDEILLHVLNGLSPENTKNLVLPCVQGILLFHLRNYMTSWLNMKSISSEIWKWKKFSMPLPNTIKGHRITNHIIAICTTIKGIHQVLSFRTPISFK